LSVAEGLCYPARSSGRGGFPRAGRVDTQQDKGLTISRDLRVNQMIRIPQVRVVDEEGAQLGVMPTPRALEMAQERGYDLVEVAPMAQPPVVRFLDFGQYKYELTKREKEAKRKQRSVTFKEVRLTPKIGTGDFDTKVHRAIEFLSDGDRIKVTVRFRGRELTHPEIGRNLLSRFVDRVKEHGVAERTPLLEGKSMHITMASVHKPKGHDAPDRKHPPEVTPADATAETPPATEAPAAAAETAQPVPAAPAETPAASTETPAAAPATETRATTEKTATKTQPAAVEPPANGASAGAAQPAAVASPKASAATPEPVQAGE
jgi:translation initiation factor IF-3